MVLIPVLIGIPVLLAVLMALLKDGRIQIGRASCRERVSSPV